VSTEQQAKVEWRGEDEVLSEFHAEYGSVDVLLHRGTSGESIYRVIRYIPVGYNCQVSVEYEGPSISEALKAHAVASVTVS
jgi:hypothetical protein